MTPRKSLRQGGFSRWAIAGVLVGLLALGSIGWVLFGPAPRAPDMTFTTLKGEKFSTADLRGKVILVNFWATSCVTCVAEMPQLVETYNRYKDRGLDFVAVAMYYDRPDYVLNFTNERQLPFKVVLDLQGEAAKRFGDVQMTPTTYLIGKDGRFIRRYLGEPNFEELHKLIEQKLAA